MSRFTRVERNHLEPDEPKFSQEDIDRQCSAMTEERAVDKTTQGLMADLNTALNEPYPQYSDILNAVNAVHDWLEPSDDEALEILED